jgi:hypothetical protein
MEQVRKAMGITYALSSISPAAPQGLKHLAHVWKEIYRGNNNNAKVCWICGFGRYFESGSGTSHEFDFDSTGAYGFKREVNVSGEVAADQPQKECQAPEKNIALDQCETAILHYVDLKK